MSCPTSDTPTGFPSVWAPISGRSSANGSSAPSLSRSRSPPGSITFRYQARDVHLVLSPGATGPIPFRVLIDGEAPGLSHGVDVDEEGSGLLKDGRLYQFVRERDSVRERTLEISFLEAGAEAYAFTFG